MDIYLIETKITTPECRSTRSRFYGTGATRAFRRHLLPRLILMPLLPLFLPLDQGVDLLNCLRLVNLPHIRGPLKQSVHIQLPALRPLPQELQDPFQPAHELGEEPVVVDVDLVDELVEVVLVARTEVDEGLHGLVRVGGDVLPLAALDHANGVVGKLREIGYAAVDVGGFVDAD